MARVVRISSAKSGRDSLITRWDTPSVVARANATRMVGKSTRLPRPIIASPQLAYWVPYHALRLAGTLVPGTRRGGSHCCVRATARAARASTQDVFGSAADPDS